MVFGGCIFFGWLVGAPLPVQSHIQSVRQRLVGCCTRSHHGLDLGLGAPRLAQRSEQCLSGGTSGFQDWCSSKMLIKPKQNKPTMKKVVRKLFELGLGWPVLFPSKNCLPRVRRVMSSRRKVRIKGQWQIVTLYGIRGPPRTFLLQAAGKCVSSARPSHTFLFQEQCISHTAGQAVKCVRASLRGSLISRGILPWNKIDHQSIINHLELYSEPIPD